MQGKSASSSYVPAIDGLRAIAVLSVLVYHWRHTLLPGGFTGVDVFFVISGYVISKSLAGSGAGGLHVAPFRDFILRFYQRRFLRIVPALLFMLLLTGLASAFFVPQGWLSAPNKWTAIAASFGVSNFYLVSGADGYFSERMPFNPYVHTWSLAVEEQFYLLFPLIFYLWLRARARGSNSLWQWALPAFAGASLLLAVWMTTTMPSHAFYLLPSRFWEMAAGALLFQWQAMRGVRTSVSSRWLLWSGGALLALGFVYADAAAFPFPWALLPVIGTVLMLAGLSHFRPGAQPHGDLAASLLASQPARYIGRLSYSLYLVHWPVFSLFRWTVGMEELLPASIALALTFALAMFSYHIVESRLRESGTLRAQSSRRVVVLGLGSMAATAGFLVLLFNPVYRLSASVTRDVAVWDPQYTPRPHGARVDGIGLGKRLLVVGDSHAGAYATMVGKAANDLGADARIFTRSGCAIAKLTQIANDEPACRDVDRDALAWLQAEARPGDIVFLASLRLDTFGNQWSSFDVGEVMARAQSPARIAEREQALQQAEAFVRRCHELGLTVLIDAPKPIFKAPPFRCADWYNRHNPICAPGFAVDRELLIRHREPVMRSLATLQHDSGVVVWDPFPVLCDTPVCSAFRDGKPMFVDGHHLSGYGNQVLVPSFRRQLQAIWRERVATASNPR